MFIATGRISSGETWSSSWIQFVNLEMVCKTCHIQRAVLKLYSLQRRRGRYINIYVWKILEYQVPNFSPPSPILAVTSIFSDMLRNLVCVQVKLVLFMIKR